MNDTIIHFVRRQRLTATVVAIALAIGFLLAAPTPRAEASGIPGAYETFITPAANARTDAGACEGLPFPAICGETCLVTMDGDVIPQGIFICIPA